MSANLEIPLQDLTPSQLSALFDILIHAESYSEIEFFKTPGAISRHGFPFAPQTANTTAAKSSFTPDAPRSKTPVPPSDDETSPKQTLNTHENDTLETETPLLATILNQFALLLPGIRQLPADFWRVRFQGIIWRFEDAELSESYDKGSLGLRKTLATLAASVYELISRGLFGGVQRSEVAPVSPSNAESQTGEGARGGKSGEEKESTAEKSSKYDLSKAADLERAWDETVQELVYGHLLNEMCDHLTRTDDFEGYSPLVEASTRYSIIHIAAFIHYIFVISPEGQYLLKLIENVHSLIPYKMVKQTLRINNPSLMISGMIRLLLTKLSVASVTNWVGLTSNADDGMNLVQRIIALTLSWDSSELKKSAEKIERSKGGPSRDMLAAIRDWVKEQRVEHDTVRAASREKGQSIITALFNARNPKLNDGLTETLHEQCLQYLSAMLSIRDRDAITSVLCRQPPDLFTASAKDLVAAYDATIRVVYANVDLKEHLESAQTFIDNFIRVSKPKKARENGGGGMMATIWGSSSSESTEESKMPAVEDYVDLLMNHRVLLWKWFHAIAKGCPDVWDEYRAWTIEAAKRFRTEDREKTMEERLNGLLQSIEKGKKDDVLKAVDEHAKYLSAISERSQERLQQIAIATSSPSPSSTRTTTAEDGKLRGPGIYLSRWQDYLDDALITPNSPNGKVRRGEEVKRSIAAGKTTIAGVVGPADKGVEKLDRPNVDVVVGELGSAFAEILKDIGGLRKLGENSNRADID